MFRTHYNSIKNEYAHVHECAMLLVIFAVTYTDLLLAYQGEKLLMSKQTT